MSRTWTCVGMQEQCKNEPTKKHIRKIKQKCCGHNRMQTLSACNATKIEAKIYVSESAETSKQITTTAKHTHNIHHLNRIKIAFPSNKKERFRCDQPQNSNRSTFNELFDTHSSERAREKEAKKSKYKHNTRSNSLFLSASLSLSPRGEKWNRTNRTKKKLDALTILYMTTIVSQPTNQPINHFPINLFRSQFSFFQLLTLNRHMGSEQSS